MLEVAVIVPVPLKLFRCALTEPDPFSAIVIDVTLVVIEHATGVAVADGDGDGLTVAEGTGVALGYGLGVALADGSGVGVALADGSGVGVADADGDGDGLAPASGVGVGSEITLPPKPFRITAGREPSSNISESMVTSPEPVI